MIIRKFMEEDREALRHVYFTSRESEFGWLDKKSLSASDFDQDTEGEKIWVAEKPEGIVGFISVWEPENFIHHLFILPQILRQGIGSKLLEACMAEIGKPAQLKCVIENVGAFGFYQSKGWYVVSEDVKSDCGFYLMQAD